MRFRTKLALISTLGVLVLSACTIWPILGVIWSSFDHLASLNFTGMRQGLDSMQAERVSRMRQVGKLIMEIPDLRALIAEDNFEISSDNLASLQDRLNDLSHVVDVGFFCVLDSRGTLIAQNSSSPWPALSDARRYLAQSDQARSLVRRLYLSGSSGAPAAQGQYGLWLYRGQLYQVVGLPLVFGGGENGQACDGAMIMATPMTSEMARNLAASHHCDLTFLTRDGGIISSLPAEQSRQLEQASKRITWKASATFDINLGSTTFRSYSEPLIDPCSQTAVGQVVSQTSMAEWSSLQWRLSQHLSAIMGGGMLIAALVSLSLSGAITKPVRELLGSVRRVAEGDLHATIAVSRRDEIGELASAFNNMLAQLQARRELEIRVAESQAASKAKSQFLANMSHEIRTPLHGVIGMANLLLGTDLSDRQRHYAQLVRSSSEVLTTLIGDILDFSKIEAGKLELESVEFNLHAVVEDVVELLYQKAIDKGVEIICDIAADVPEKIFGDPTRVRQILLNLVGNAVKFTQSGQVVVHVSAQRQPDGVAVLRFEIIDSGIGISPEGVARLFQSFSQVDASTTRRFGGTGLGLAICKQLCELMGGAIGVESEVGRGSTFWFTASAKAADISTSVAPPLSGIRILVADPNAAVCEALSRQLAILGADATAAPGRACQLIAESKDAGRPFQVILASKSADGFAAIVRETTECGIAAVLLASAADHTAPAALREAGFAAAVAKPVRRARLSSALADALGLAEHTSGAPAAEIGRPQSVPAKRNVRVLVAEDNEVNQIVAEQFLAKAGFDCLVVADGKAAVDALTDGAFDVVLMDCQMPVMDGFKATQLIRQREASRPATGQKATSIPIIALTANASGADRGRCLAAGMNAYCGKPFREKELLDTIAALLPSYPSDAPIESVRPAAAPPSKLEEPASSGSTAAVLDVAALLDRCSGNSDLALKILDKFEGQVAGLIAQLHGCAQKDDAAQLARVAHTMKGTAGVIGAEPLRLALAELEQLGRKNALVEVPASLQRLQDEISRCSMGVVGARSVLQSTSIGSG
jgi:two-component system sensor histidine kinase/response regulator